MINDKFQNKTALCYTNTIFSKLLKYHQSRQSCIEEGGHILFIKILQDPDNKNLYLETLDTIKLFLTKREYLVKFKTIPACFREYDNNCEELDVSIMQVLAILSFEKDCHESLKKSNFLEELNRKGFFKKIFDQFDNANKERSSTKQNQNDLLNKLQSNNETIDKAMFKSEQSMDRNNLMNFAKL